MCQLSSHATYKEVLTTLKLLFSFQFEFHCVQKNMAEIRQRHTRKTLILVVDLLHV
jgi:hypothetical protein